MQNRSPLYFTFIVSLGGFLFGFDASVISGAIVYLDTIFELNSSSKGWIVSAPSFKLCLLCWEQGCLVIG